MKCKFNEDRRSNQILVQADNQPIPKKTTFYILGLLLIVMEGHKKLSV